MTLHSRQPKEMRLSSRTTAQVYGILWHIKHPKGQRKMDFFSNRRTPANSRSGTSDAGNTDATALRAPMVAPLPFGPSRMQPCTELFEEDGGITGVFYPDDQIGSG